MLTYLWVLNSCSSLWYSFHVTNDLRFMSHSARKVIFPFQNGRLHIVLSKAVKPLATLGVCVRKRVQLIMTSLMTSLWHVTFTFLTLYMQHDVFPSNLLSFSLEKQNLRNKFLISRQVV